MVLPDTAAPQSITLAFELRAPMNMDTLRAELLQGTHMAIGQLATMLDEELRQLKTNPPPAQTTTPTLEQAALDIMAKGDVSPALQPRIHQEDLLEELRAAILAGAGDATARTLACPTATCERAVTDRGGLPSMVALRRSVEGALEHGARYISDERSWPPSIRSRLEAAFEAAWPEHRTANDFGAARTVYADAMVAHLKTALPSHAEVLLIAGRPAMQRSMQEVMAHAEDVAGPISACTQDGRTAAAMTLYRRLEQMSWAANDRAPRGLESVEERYLHQLLTSLNEEAGRIAERLESDVRGMMGIDMPLKAQVTFRRGSLTMLGTIVVLDWAGSLLAGAARTAVEQYLTEATKLAVQRIFTSLTGQLGLGSMLDEPETQASVKSVATTQQPVGGARDGSTRTESDSRVPGVVSGPASWRGDIGTWLLQLLTLVLVLALVLNQYLVVTVRP